MLNLGISEEFARFLGICKAPCHTVQKVSPGFQKDVNLGTSDCKQCLSNQNGTWYISTEVFEENVNLCLKS